MRFSKKVAARGNLTVPTDIRDALDIEDGDIVEMEVVGIVRRSPASATAEPVEFRSAIAYS
jgi:bifunctional DNA-binding transcriptional regulator/antitoxin component of YhaV-PrlF toxin-antitoxin module